MENLKIKIDGKDECAEAQELLFELGFDILPDLKDGDSYC